jgi:hypothetical protein
LAVSATETWRGHHSLLLQGTGLTARASTVVEQVFNALPSAQPGSEYEFGFVAFRRHLSRRVISWVKLNYVDGSYQALLARRLGEASHEGGITSGDDLGWKAYAASVRAAKPVSTIQLFVSDTGPQQLRGAVAISDVSLTLRPRGVRRFRNVPALPARGP